MKYQHAILATARSPHRPRFQNAFLSFNSATSRNAGHLSLGKLALWKSVLTDFCISSIDLAKQSHALLMLRGRVKALLAAAKVPRVQYVQYISRWLCSHSFNGTIWDVMNFFYNRALQQYVSCPVKTICCIPCW